MLASIKFWLVKVEVHTKKMKGGLMFATLEVRFFKPVQNEESFLL